jgi:UDP-N-acetylmuramate dehydrogenase
VLRAAFRLRRDEPARIVAEIEAIRAWRAANQPTEPSAGSIFTNPPDDYAGRLIERAGLKGVRIGGAEISERHANFIVNRGGATARDVHTLILRMRAEVLGRFGVTLVEEVERFGDWEASE